LLQNTTFAIIGANSNTVGGFCLKVERLVVNVPTIAPLAKFSAMLVLLKLKLVGA